MFSQSDSTLQHARGKFLVLNDSEDSQNAKIIYPKIEEVQSPSTDYSDTAESQSELGTPIKTERMSKKSSLVSSTNSINEISSLKSQSALLHKESGEDETVDEEAESGSRKGSYDSSSDADEDETVCSLKNWSEKKDKILKSLATKCKYDWKKIAKKFNGSDKNPVAPLELKQRYKEITKVAIPLRVKFNHNEDLLIAKYFDIYGCDWVQISNHFTDRTPIMLKNRYYSHIRKKNLLSSMLHELKDTDKEITSEENSEEHKETTDETQTEEENDEKVEEKTEVIPETQMEEETEGEYIRFFMETENGLTCHNVSIRPVQSLFLEVEDGLSSILYDRITFSQF